MCKCHHYTTWTAQLWNLDPESHVHVTLTCTTHLIVVVDEAPVLFLWRYIDEFTTILQKKKKKKREKNKESNESQLSMCNICQNKHKRGTTLKSTGPKRSATNVHDVGKQGKIPELQVLLGQTCFGSTWGSNTEMFLIIIYRLIPLHCHVFVFLICRMKYDYYNLKRL